MTTYRIKDWESHYETAETRKLEKLRWVATPNKHDGLGFRRLAAHRDRNELFAAWVLMVQVASKGRKAERGWLKREGEALDAEGMSLMTGFPAVSFEKAFEFFSNPKQGWLIVEQNGDIPAIAASCTGQPAGSPANPPSSPGCPADAPAEGRKEGRKEIAPAKPPRKPVARNPLLDALAIVDGSDPAQVTSPAWGAIAKALADIRSVFPNVTVEEIRRRAEAYRKMHPDWPLTPSALAKHWASCVPGSTTPPRPDIYAEPEGWREVYRDIADARRWNRERVDEMCRGEWLDLSTDLRADILKNLKS